MTHTPIEAAPSVKPLVWSQSNVFGSQKRRGFSPFGEWIAFGVDGLTEEEVRAKEAEAQAGYAARILSVLALPVKEAPVAWRWRDKENDGLDEWHLTHRKPLAHTWNVVVPLYAAPPQSVGIPEGFVAGALHPTEPK